jgi:hypothetical protein
MEGCEENGWYWRKKKSLNPLNALTTELMKSLEINRLTGQGYTNVLYE